MVGEIRRSAPSVEEAIEAALTELGVSEQEALIEVVQESRQGLFGVGAQEAIVVVRARPTAEGLTEEDAEEQVEIGVEFLEGLLARMGVDASVEPNLEGATMYIDIIGEDPDDQDMGLLIGRHGQTLDALQELTRVVVGGRTGARSRLVVDVEDYRKRQVDRLTARVREIGRRVAKTRRAEALEPMNPFLRKIVHDAVAEIDGVQSVSEGDDPDRRVVIRPRG